MGVVDFYNPTIIKEPAPSYIEKLFPELPRGRYRRDDIPIDDPRHAGDYCVYALFQIIEQDFSYKFKCFHTRGTSSCLSLYSMVQGIYHINEFGEGAEISEDYDRITNDQILRLPMDYNLAVKYINENLIGKTLRVIARSAAGSTKYGTRYYIFAIED